MIANYRKGRCKGRNNRIRYHSQCLPCPTPRHISPKFTISLSWQILVVFTTDGVQEGFLGEVPVEQSLEVAEYTGPGYLTSVTPFGGFPLEMAVLPWMPASGAALLSLKAAQGSYYTFTILNTANRPFMDTDRTVSEYYVRE